MLDDLAIGQVVYLDGVVYTGREGLYRRVLDEGEALPGRASAELTNVNFHCSPAAASDGAGGGYRVGGGDRHGELPLLASGWRAGSISRARNVIIGKGGMSVERLPRHLRAGAARST